MLRNDTIVTCSEGIKRGDRCTYDGTVPSDCSFSRTYLYGHLIRETENRIEQEFNNDREVVLAAIHCPRSSWNANGEHYQPEGPYALVPYRGEG